MSVSNFIPTIWSDQTVDSYQNKLVFGSLANRDWEGEIKQYGDTVKINGLGDVTVNTYAGTSLTYEELDDLSQVLQINQKKYVAVTLDDVDNAQTKPKLRNKYTQKMGYGIANNIDSHIASLYTQAGINDGSTSSVTAVTSANVISTFGDMAVSMDDNNVPEDGRVAVCPPWLVQKLSLAKVIRDTDNSNTLSSGFMGEFNGFQIYKSNNIQHSSTTWYAPMFFVMGDTISMAEQLMNMEALRDKDTFGDYLRALVVYGAKVTRPDSLGVLYCSNGSESAI